MTVLPRGHRPLWSSRVVIGGRLCPIPPRPKYSSGEVAEKGLKSGALGLVARGANRSISEDRGGHRQARTHLCGVRAAQDA